MKNIRGLTTTEVKKSEKENGRNTLTAKKRRSFFDVYWKNYDDPIIIVLLIALGINVIFTFIGKVDWYECAGILLSVIISTFVSALSEYSNENTFLKIQDEASDSISKVWRNGKLCEVHLSEIVVGDMVLLQAGDLVPADGRIFDGAVMIDQSPLNGESKETEKKASGTLSPKPRFNDFWNDYSVFRGCIVCSGEAAMYVDTVGDKTVYGNLSAETQEEGRESPLFVKLAGLAESISKFGMVSAVVIMIISFLNTAFIQNGFNPSLISNYFADSAQVVSDFVSSLILCIIVIVVAVPEGLPLMIAIVCSLNMKKMLKANVLVRKMIGIETAGGMNILFTDKTGTLTAGKPKVVCFIDGDGNESTKFDKMPKGLAEVALLSITANSSARFSGGKTVGGNATEKALIDFAGKRASAVKNISILKSIPFSSDKKYSAAYVSVGKKLTLIKGAPEILLSKCVSYYNGNGEKKKFNPCETEKKLKEYAENSVRVIALAISEEELEDEKLPQNMTLVGIAAIRDDIRPEAKEAVADVLKGGIQVIMITGDKAETAASIAKEVGLMQDDDLLLTSEELAEMNDDEVRAVINNLRVVARAVPSDKSRLVKIAQSMNLVVGMTGDGVNDAPALKLADVGFAMGGGTEAAASASDIVILDDNFKSVRNAVLYGRTIYRSIKKFIRFQLTINVAAVTVSMLGPIVGIEKPLNISQMIWTNLIIDSLAAIAFGGEPALNRFMNEKPRKRDEAIIDREMWSGIAIDGLYICFLSLLFFTVPAVKNIFRTDADGVYFYTGYFTFFIFISVFNAFNARCDGINLLENLSLNKQFLFVMAGVSVVQIIMTYCGGRLLRTSGLNMCEWGTVILLAFTIFPIELVRKLVLKYVNPYR